jgi:hypothetical protein
MRSPDCAGRLSDCEGTQRRADICSRDSGLSEDQDRTFSYLQDRHHPVLGLGQFSGRDSSVRLRIRYSTSMERSLHEPAHPHQLIEEPKTA